MEFLLDLLVEIVAIAFLFLVTINFVGLFIRYRGQTKINEAQAAKDGSIIVKNEFNRNIEYMTYGDNNPTAPVFISIHGSSMEAGFERDIHGAACNGLEVRGISISLPGYGNTDYKIGRKVVDWVSEDLLTVLDKEGVDEFYITGHSQGTAHAMAAAYMLPDRVLGLGLNALVLPAALCEEVDITGALGAGSLPYTSTLKKWYMGWYFFLLEMSVNWLGPYLPYWGIKAAIPDLKKQTLLSERIKKSFRRSVIRTGCGNVWESAEDVCYDWGFDPRLIKVNNICVWHAADDNMAPADNGSWFAEYFSKKRVASSTIDTICKT